MDWNNLQIWQELHGVVSTNHTSVPGHENVLSIIDQELRRIERPGKRYITKCVNNRVDNVLQKVEPHTTNHDHSPLQLVVMTQLHICKSSSRMAELTEAINLNISCLGKSIDELILFTENIPPESVLKLLKMDKPHSAMTIVPVTKRMTYKDYMSFSRDKLNHDVLVLITNSDCSYDQTLNILKHLKYMSKSDQHVCYTITRNEDGKPCRDPQAHLWSPNQYANDTMNANSSIYLEPWSTDAWCYSNKILSTDVLALEELNIPLGTNACEILFKTHLHNRGVNIYNVGFGGYVSCRHHHDSEYRESVNWQKSLPELVPGFYPTPEQPRNIDNSICNCHRIRSTSNWLDSDTYNHQYTDYVVTNIEPHLVQCHTNRVLLMLVTTLKEFESGFITNTLNRYMLNNNSDYIFDILVTVDNSSDEMEQHIKQLNNQLPRVGNIMLHSIDMSEQENVYYRSWKDGSTEKPETMPRLGYSTGPNALFFESMKHASTLPYDNVLLIETDTAPVNAEWFDICYNYTYSNDFLIAGSTYKGNLNKTDADSWHANFLNGVGIYKNDPILHHVLRGTEQLLNQLMIDGHFSGFMNYDVAIGYYMQVTHHEKHHMYTDTDIFTNVSLDNDIDPELVLQQHPDTCIMHHKQFQTTSTN